MTVFIILWLIVIAESIYIWGLWLTVKQEEKSVAWAGPLFSKEDEQRRDIESLVKDGGSQAIDRLIRYGKGGKARGNVFLAITGIKQIGTPYGNEKLQELIAEEQGTFVQDMALTAYKIYGSKEDVPALQKLSQKTTTTSQKEKLNKLILLLQHRQKESDTQARTYTFIEMRDKNSK